MTDKLYDIFLDNEKIGMTALEKADAPMGVVFGQIHFISITSGYDFFKTYCVKNNIKIVDFPEDRLMQSLEIPNLKVVDNNGNEIKGQACYSINGMDSDHFYVTIVVSYPFYEEEFPHHVQAYHDLFKK